MKSLIRFLIAFLALTGAVALSTVFLGMDFGRANYWDHHGFLFLIAISIFPRLTLLLSSISFGGLLGWLGWIFAPRILVAVLATMSYWHENPILVVLAWLVALGGESSEKYVVVHRARRPGSHGFESARWVKHE